VRHAARRPNDIARTCFDECVACHELETAFENFKHLVLAVMHMRRRSRADGIFALEHGHAAARLRSAQQEPVLRAEPGKLTAAYDGNEFRLACGADAS